MIYSGIVHQAIGAFDRLSSGEITREDLDTYKAWYAHTLMQEDPSSLVVETFIKECEEKLNGKA